MESFFFDDIAGGFGCCERFEDALSLDWKVTDFESARLCKLFLEFSFGP